MINQLVILLATLWIAQGISALPANDVNAHLYKVTLTDETNNPYKKVDYLERDFQSRAGRQRRETDADEPEDEAPETARYTYRHDTDPVGMGQHFFPSFFPSFSNARQYQQNPTARPTSHRSNSNFQPIGFLHQAEADSSQGNVLGSGNFGVIRGGTFYNDADRDQGQASDYDSHQVYTPYYRNGHGRPSFYRGGGSNPRPQKQGNDYFANFRDFADINAPTKSSYSELYVVYVNKNATRHDDPSASADARPRGADKPKNIIEQLALIENEQDEHVATIQPKKAVLSAGKLKLARTFKAKREKVKKTPLPKDLYEPLLALS